MTFSKNERGDPNPFLDLFFRAEGAEERIAPVVRHFTAPGRPIPDGHQDEVSSATGISGLLPSRAKDQEIPPPATRFGKDTSKTRHPTSVLNGP